jgi:hypothetical protein
MLTQFFSLIIDEVTCLEKKYLCIISRYYNFKQKLIETMVYDLSQIIESNAQVLSAIIIDTLKKDGIPSSHLIGVGCDGAKVNLGEKSSIMTALKNINPHTIFMYCLCHGTNLVASKACGEIPYYVEKLLHDVYNYFSQSPKRLCEFIHFQLLSELEPSRILEPCQTRWLSLEAYVLRFLKEYNNLLLYFSEKFQKQVESQTKKKKKTTQIRKEN